MARITPTNESPHTVDPPTRTFTRFPELPREIQLQIWQHAVPDPQSILGVVRVILDFDLGKPRAILPALREFKESYRLMHFPEDEELDNYSYGLSGDSIWSPSDTTMAASRRTVFTLLHTCRLARIATLERYRLAVGSELEEENKPWWVPEEDMVIFTGSDQSERLALLHWLFQERERCLSVFDSLEHLALRCEYSVANYLVSPSWNDVPHLENDSLCNFPALQSFTLLVDPARVLERKSGRVLLYEPEQNPVEAFRRYLPTAIVRRVTMGFEEVLPEDMEVPLVEVFVAGWKKR